LKSPLAQRLLEVLESEFSDHEESESILIGCDVLGALMPISGKIPSGRRREMLDEGHKVLIQEGYLARVQRIASRGKEWFGYQPGPTFHALRHRLRSTKPEQLRGARYPLHLDARVSMKRIDAG